MVVTKKSIYELIQIFLQITRQIFKNRKKTACELIHILLPKQLLRFLKTIKQNLW